MKIEREDSSGVVVLGIDGDIAEQAVYQLKELLLDLLSKGTNNIILNLRDVGYISSAGLGIIAAFDARAKKQDGGIRLAAVPTEIMSLLETTKLVDEFAIDDDVEKSLANF